MMLMTYLSLVFSGTACKTKSISSAEIFLSTILSMKNEAFNSRRRSRSRHKTKRNLKFSLTPKFKTIHWVVCVSGRTHFKAMKRHCVRVCVCCIESGPKKSRNNASLKFRNQTTLFVCVRVCTIIYQTESEKNQQKRNEFTAIIVVVATAAEFQKAKRKNSNIIFYSCQRFHHVSHIWFANVLICKTWTQTKLPNKNLT